MGRIDSNADWRIKLSIPLPGRPRLIVFPRSVLWGNIRSPVVVGLGPPFDSQASGYFPDFCIWRNTILLFRQADFP